MLTESQYLGIDIGGTKISIGVVSHEGRILSAVNYPTRWGTYETFIGQLCNDIADFLQRHKDLEFASAGVGFRALVDYNRQLVSSASIISDARDFDVCKCINSMVKVPVILDNDVNAMAWGELVFGNKMTQPSFVYINIGTGLGLGIVVNGHLVRGYRYQAGEVTRYLTNKESYVDLESLISGRGIENRVRQLLPTQPGSLLASEIDKEKISTSDVISAWRLHDSLATKIMEEGIRELALAIINMEAVLNSGLYIFGGGVIGDGWIISQIEREIQLISCAANIPFEVELRLSKFGSSQAGLIGAASLCIHEVGGI